MNRNIWTGILAIISGILISANNFKVAATMPLLMNSLQIDAGAAGNLITVVSMVGVILGIPAGGLLIRHGSKKIMVFALFCGAIGAIYGGLCNGFVSLMISRFIEGVGFALIGVAVPSVIAECFDEKHRGVPMAVWSCWVSLGLFLALNLTSIIADEAYPETWKNVWGIIGILILILTILYFLTSKKISGTGKTEKINPALFWNPGAITLAIIFLCFSSGITAITNFSNNYCTQILGIGLVQANSVSSLLTIGLLLGGLVTGFVINCCKSYGKVLIFEMIVCNIIYGTMFLYTEQIAMIYMFLVGAMLGSVPTTIFSIAPNCATEIKTVGVVMGILAVGQNIGGFFAGLIGTMIETFGFSITGFMISGFSILGTLMAIYFLRKQDDMLLGQHSNNQEESYCNWNIWNT